MSRSLRHGPPPDSGSAQDPAAALRRFDLLRPHHLEALDRIARIAAHVMHGAGGGVSLVEEERIRFAGRALVSATSIPRTEDAFCRVVAEERQPLAVPDALADPRFAASDLVTDAGAFPGGALRMYAGVPLEVGGHAIGSVWAYDTRPHREIAPDRLAILGELARTAAREIEQGFDSVELEHIFDHAPDLIFRVSERGEILRLNAAYGRLFGTDPDRVVGEHFAQHIHPDHVDAAMDAFRRVLAGQKVRFAVDALDVDGAAVPLDVISVPRVVAGHVIEVLGFARDLRDRREIEELAALEAKRASERQQRLDRLARASSDVLWEFDLQTGEGWWSQGMERLFGYPAEADRGPGWWEDRLHADDRDRVTANLEATMARGEKRWQDEYRFRRADGTYAHAVDRAYIDYGASGDAVRIYGGMVDVTEMRETQQALERTEERFRELFDRAPIGIYRTTPDGTILLANDAIVRMLGFESFEQLAGRDIETEGYGPDHPRSEFRERIDNQAKVEGFESVWLKRDGTPIAVREHAHAVRNADGSIAYYEGTVEDVTQQRRFEDALRHLVESSGATSGDVFLDLIEALAQALGTNWAVFVRPTVDDKLEVVAGHRLGDEQLLPSCEPLRRVLAGHSVEILAGFEFHCDDGPALLNAVPAKAMIGAPVRSSQGEVIGALLAFHDAPIDPPSSTERWLLSAFAQRAGAELEQREHTQRLEATAHAADVLRTAESVGEVYERATREVLAITAARSVSIVMHDEELDRLKVEHAAGAGAAQARGRHIARGEGITWRVLDTGKPLYVPDLAREEGALFLSGPRTAGSYAAAPLVDQHGKTFGALVTDTASGRSLRTLSRLDLYYVQAMAQAIGVSIARLRALEQARAQGDRFRSLAELSATLELIDDPMEIARTALEALLPLTGFAQGTLWTVDGHLLRRRIAVGRNPPELDGVFRDRDLRNEPGLLGEVVQALRTIWVADYANSRYALPSYRDVGLSSVLATPLLLSGRVYGAVVLSSFEGSAPETHEMRSLLQAVAHRVERALQRAAVRGELVDTRESALRALGLALEYRDYETKGHTDRVTSLALRLGRSLGLSGEELQHLRWGAYLHDTGKVSIPDHILLKPDKLDAAEWRRMKEHVTIGEAMLRQLDFMPEPVLELVRHHHERWDGSGYPDGLAGESIPLLARIFAVVDVYDALLSERPYKEAWLPEEAIAEIAAAAGSQFDPRIVRAFSAMSLDGDDGAGTV